MLDAVPSPNRGEPYPPMKPTRVRAAHHEGTLSGVAFLARTGVEIATALSRLFGERYFCTPLGRAHEVTRGKDNLLIELDGLPGARLIFIEDIGENSSPRKPLRRRSAGSSSPPCPSRAPTRPTTRCATSSGSRRPGSAPSSPSHRRDRRGGRPEGRTKVAAILPASTGRPRWAGHAKDGGATPSSAPGRGERVNPGRGQTSPAPRGDPTSSPPRMRWTLRTSSSPG